MYAHQLAHKTTHCSVKCCAARALMLSMEFQFLAKTVSLFIKVVFPVHSTEQDTPPYTTIIFLYFFFFLFILRYAAFLPLPSFPVNLAETTSAIPA